MLSSVSRLTYVNHIFRIPYMSVYLTFPRSPSQLSNVVQYLFTNDHYAYSSRMNTREAYMYCIFSLSIVFQIKEKICYSFRCYLCEPPLWKLASKVLFHYNHSLYLLSHITLYLNQESLTYQWLNTSAL